jgi:hypothetical protein
VRVKFCGGDVAGGMSAARAIGARPTRAYCRMIDHNRVVERPAMRLSGPVVEAPDVAALVRFYERFLGWEVEELVGPRHDRPPGWGWGAPAFGQSTGPKD